MTRKELIKTLKELEEVGEDFVKEEQLIDTLEKNLNFKSEEQHQYWLGVLFSYKFWEDFEELTLSIINQNKKGRKTKRDEIIKYLKNLKKRVFSGYHYPINETIKLLEMLEEQTKKRRTKLPQKETIKNGLLMAKSYKKMPSCESMELEQIIEEFISMYLTDNHDKNIKGFKWETHNNDIKVSNIIWEK